MATAAAREWGSWTPSSLVHTDVHSFAPLFGLRHIPDAAYPTLDRLCGWLPGNLILGVARKSRLGQESA